jgi:hypothetical protein
LSAWGRGVRGGADDTSWGRKGSAPSNSDQPRFQVGPSLPRQHVATGGGPTVCCGETLRAADGGVQDIRPAQVTLPLVSARAEGPSDVSKFGAGFELLALTSPTHPNRLGADTRLPVASTFYAHPPFRRPHPSRSRSCRRPGRVRRLNRPFLAAPSASVGPPPSFTPSGSNPFRVLSSSRHPLG